MSVWTINEINFSKRNHPFIISIFSKPKEMKISYRIQDFWLVHLFIYLLICLFIYRKINFCVNNNNKINWKQKILAQKNEFCNIIRKIKFSLNFWNFIALLLLQKFFEILCKELNNSRKMLLMTFISKVDLCEINHQRIISFKQDG